MKMIFSLSIQLLEGFKTHKGKGVIKCDFSHCSKGKANTINAGVGKENSRLEGKGQRIYHK